MRLAVTLAPISAVTDGQQASLGRHLRPQEPGELPGDRGDDHILGVLAGGQATKAAAQPQLGRPGPGHHLGIQALLAVAQVGPDRGPVLVGQADSTSWVRRCSLPHLVMWPRRVELPLEYSEGTRPQKPLNAAARPNRRQSQTSLARVSAPSWVMPR